MRSKRLTAGTKNKRDLELMLRSIFGDQVEAEFRFHPTRRWRFDYAVPGQKLAVEYHGHSGFVGGKVSGHSTIKGLTNDCEKSNAANRLGWRVIAFTALHFREADRAKHKLTSPIDTLQEMARVAITH